MEDKPIERRIASTSTPRAPANSNSGRRVTALAVPVAFHRVLFFLAPTSPSYGGQRQMGHRARLRLFSAPLLWSPRLPVHVSIHDVSPASRDEVEEALSLCGAAGARPALLVVPNFHGRAPLLDDAPFCARLRELQARGHEIVLHGLTHQCGARVVRQSGPGRLSWLLAQRLMSNGEAEMADLGPDEGRARIDEGERVLRAAGLRVDGFVAPAWSMPAWLLPALAERGVRFTEDHLRVYDPAGGRGRPSVVLNWATRSPARLVSTLAWCALAKHARTWLPARIAIHPADLGFLVVRRRIEAMLAWARGDFVSCGAELLD